MVAHRHDRLPSLPDAAPLLDGRDGAMIALMRLTNLDLHNFRCYVDLSLRLDPATVIIGPNDAGKSTILDAIRCLLTKTDRNGQRFERRTVATMRELNLFLVYDEGELRSSCRRIRSLSSGLSVTSRRTSYAHGNRSSSTARSGSACCSRPMGFKAAAMPRRGLGSGRCTSCRTGTLVGWSPELGGRERALMGARWVPMYGLSLGSLPEFVFVPGPDVAPPAPAEYLGPVVDAAARRVAARLPEELLDTLVAEVGEATDAISAALTRVVPDTCRRRGGRRFGRASRCTARKACPMMRADRWSSTSSAAST